MISQTTPPDPVVLSLSAQADSVSQVRHEVRHFVEHLGRRSEEIELAVSEAVANAVQHAFRGRDAGTIEVRLDLLVPDTLMVTVVDDGDGMSPDPHSMGLGYGLALIGRLSDGFEVNSAGGGGTEVRMRFGLGPRAASPEAQP